MKPSVYAVRECTCAFLACNHMRLWVDIIASFGEIRVGLNSNRTAHHRKAAAGYSIGRHSCVESTSEWRVRNEKDCLSHRNSVQQFGELESGTD